MTDNSHRPLEPLDYLPQEPRERDHPIALIGCGGITEHHLTAYRNAGYHVVAFCDVDRERACSRRDEFYPDAEVFDDYQDVLRLDEVQVVDVATHPGPRVGILRDALNARKHVLSQKPFVVDLNIGRELVELAAERNVKLAVNQNARWAPHFAYLRAALDQGLLGQVATAHLSVHWDHTWVEGTPFEHVKHLILYDYAIHWFDMVAAIATPRVARRVFASTTRSPQQTIMPPLEGQTIIEFDDLQVSLAFDGDTQYLSQDRTYVTGTKGTFHSVGPGNRVQHVTLETEAGRAEPTLEGCWFPDGFHGTMAELLCSIEQNRDPSHDAARNLDGLAMCFAAVASAQWHQPVRPGDVARLPE